MSAWKHPPRKQRTDWSGHALVAALCLAISAVGYVAVAPHFIEAPYHAEVIE